MFAYMNAGEITITSVQTPSAKEIELVQLIANDHRADAIADMWKISARTVESKILSVKKKFAKDTMAGLVTLFFRNNLIE